MMRGWPAVVAASALLTFPGARPPRESPVMAFEEIGGKAGVAIRHHTRTFKGPYADILGTFTSGGAAVAVADYDNDGLEDVFLTDSDEGTTCHLLHNDGHLRFTDVTTSAGVGG